MKSTSLCSDARLTGATLPWYAVRTRSNRECISVSALTAKGIECFLPAVTSHRQWSDRVVKRQRPLFPGYVFCRFDAKNWLPVVTCSGVSHVVMAGPVPGVVEVSEIEGIRRIIASGLDPVVTPLLRQGDSIRVVGGVLDGLEGLLVRERSDWRLVISLTLLQRSISVEIDRHQVVPIPVRSRIARSA